MSKFKSATQNSKIDLAECILAKYEALLKNIDQNCEKVFESAPEIPCKNKCVDCCRQLFPVSFVEAFYISEGIKKLDRAARRPLARNAEKINKKILAANPFQFEQKNVDRRAALAAHAEFANFLHTIETDCPALDESRNEGACLIYPLRNHDCRVMGCSFDFSNREIIGCQRFNTLKHLLPKLMPFNYKYDEKMALDNELISAVTNKNFGQNIFYFTTICTALLKDFATTDWTDFFAKKDTPKTKNNCYWVTIDI